MSDKRKQLRDKLEAAEARHEARERADRAASPADRVTSFAREHPILLIAGGLAIGIAVSALVPRSPTRRFSKKTAAFLATVAELGIAYGREALEAAEEAGRQGKDKLAELSSTAKDKAGDQLERVSALIAGH
jgi:hypothetical protein